MKKSKKRVLKAVFIPPIIFLITLYFFFAWYYKDTFSYGTWINGIYCTGKTIDEINQELIQNTKVESIELFLRDGKKETVLLKDIDFQMDYLDLLINKQEQQNPFFWIENIFDSDGIRVQAKCTYSEEKLQEILMNMEFYKTQANMTEHLVSIELTSDGYQLSDTRADILDFSLVIDKINRSLISGKQSVYLYDEDVYYEIPMTISDLEVLALWEQIEEAQNFTCTYVFGEDEEVIDSTIVSKWISVDDKGNFILDEYGNIVIDEAKMDEFIFYLDEKYNTYGFPREYETVDGRTVSISKGNYGNLFDVEEECLYLKKAYFEKIEELHEPEYIKKALFQGMDDIGPDYIEVDLTNQKLYVVFDHVLSFETDIVTGNVALGMKTTDRICYIYSKQTNRILRGPGYASHVDYWMPVSGGIGIHDAKWRSSFGGEIYKRNGSHGCINVPKEIMPDIFERSYVGMPVIIYY
jgi:hypothetical protein